VALSGISSIMGAVNIVTTIFRMRAPGMGWFKMPAFCWTVLAAQLIQLIGLKDAETCRMISDFPYPECLQVRKRVSSSEAVAACQASQLLVIMQNRYFLDGQEFCVAIPAKLYTYLRTGILACVPESEIADLVINTGTGVWVPPDNVAAIRSAMADEFHTWEESRTPSPSVDVTKFSRRIQAGRLAEILHALVPG